MNVLDLLKYRLSPSGGGPEMQQALNEALPQIRPQRPDMSRAYGEADVIPSPNTGYQTADPLGRHPMFAPELQSRSAPQREDRLMRELDFMRKFRGDWPQPEGSGVVTGLQPGQSPFRSPLNLMRNPWALY